MSTGSARSIRETEREWVKFQIPDSSPPVEIAKLNEPADGSSRTLLVRFAPGWSRPTAGHYESAEEFFVLEGDLTIGDWTWWPGDYVYIPAGAVRGPSSSQQGALALSRFEGPARWKNER